MRTSAWNGRQSSKSRDVNEKPPSRRFLFVRKKAHGGCGGAKTIQDGCSQTVRASAGRSEKQRSRREASESVHLIELNERKLVVTDGLGNKLFIINPNKQVRNVHRIRTGNPE